MFLFFNFSFDIKPSDIVNFIKSLNLLPENALKVSLVIESICANIYLHYGGKSMEEQDKSFSQLSSIEFRSPNPGSEISQSTK